jgi:hypothetical protein
MVKSNKQLHHNLFRGFVFMIMVSPLANVVEGTFFNTHYPSKQHTQKNMYTLYVYITMQQVSDRKPPSEIARIIWEVSEDRHINRKHVQHLWEMN